MEMRPSGGSTWRHESDAIVRWHQRRGSRPQCDNGRRYVQSGRCVAWWHRPSGRGEIQSMRGVTSKRLACSRACVRYAWHDIWSYHRDTRRMPYVLRHPRLCRHHAAAGNHVAPSITTRRYYAIPNVRRPLARALSKASYHPPRNIFRAPPDCVARPTTGPPPAKRLKTELHWQDGGRRPVENVAHRLPHETYGAGERR